MLRLLREAGVPVPPLSQLAVTDPRLLCWLLEPQLLQVGGGLLLVLVVLPPDVLASTAASGGVGAQGYTQALTYEFALSCRTRS